MAQEGLTEIVPSLRKIGVVRNSDVYIYVMYVYRSMIYSIYNN